MGNKKFFLSPPSGLLIGIAAFLLGIFYSTRLNIEDPFLTIVIALVILSLFALSFYLIHGRKSISLSTDGIRIRFQNTAKEKFFSSKDLRAWSYKKNDSGTVLSRHSVLYCDFGENRLKYDSRLVPEVQQFISFMQSHFPEKLHPSSN